MTISDEMVAETVVSAEGVYVKAVEIIAHREDQAEQLMADARAALEAAQQLAIELPTAAGADRQRLATAAVRAAAEALKNTYAAIEVVRAGSTSGDKKDEWKECRSTIDRFDKLLVDLRKTGFGLITALVGAATYVFQQSTPGIKASIDCMLVLLIVTLYLIDCVHQLWLKETVDYAIELEKSLKYNLTTRISKKYDGSEAQILGFWLYFILLAVTCVIFLYSISSEGIAGGHRMTIYGAFVVGLASLIAAIFWPTIRQTFSRYKILWVAVFLIAVAAAAMLAWYHGLL